jgi:hypothetical protein
MQFTEIPKISFSINSLGGIELSTVPYAFYWVNSSIYWILEQVAYDKVDEEKDVDNDDAAADDDYYYNHSIHNVLPS